MRTMMARGDDHAAGWTLQVGHHVDRVPSRRTCEQERGRTDMTGTDVVRGAVEAALAAGSGLLLEDVTITPAGRRRVVRVTVDRLVPDDTDDVTTTVEPLTLDEVADATRLVSDALDESDVLGEQPYTLEVTTPGVGHPLTQPRHFRRNVGRLVRVVLDDGQVTGRIQRAGRSDLTVEVSATKKAPAHERRIGYDEISKAVVEVEFSRPGTGNDGGALSGQTKRGTTSRSGDETEES
jgi:ribosome maturation factor RimP